MLQHVWERTCQARYLTDVVIATDDERIRAAAEEFRARVVMTRADHVSGTDRVAEAASASQAQIVVNVQGDEPLLDPALMRRVANTLAARPDAAIATACHPITQIEDVLNANVVKVVLDARGNALYFSRAPIPWARDAFSAEPPVLPAGLPIHRHCGLYAYRVAFLRTFPALAPAPIEMHEALEQLRALWHGHRIAMVSSEAAAPPGVDTREDLEAVRRMWK